MKKKSRKLTILLCALLALLAIGVGGYTYAKYTTSMTGGGQVDIARWSFKVDNNSEQIETIRLVDTVDEKLLVNGKIAPGTGGEFTINIDGTGTEVGIDYEVKFSNEQNKPTNIVFTYNGQKYNSLASMADVIKGTINANESNKKVKITVGWEWKYETGTSNQVRANDEIDTREGKLNLDYTFDVIVKGTQKPITSN